MKTILAAELIGGLSSVAAAGVARIATTAASISASIALILPSPADRNVWRSWREPRPEPRLSRGNARKHDDQNYDESRKK
jgi:hypothetical protein